MGSAIKNATMLTMDFVALYFLNVQRKVKIKKIKRVLSNLEAFCVIFRAKKRSKILLPHDQICDSLN